mgnify:CR=1 FL=1
MLATTWTAVGKALPSAFEFSNHRSLTIVQVPSAVFVRELIDIAVKVLFETEWNVPIMTTLEDREEASTVSV